MKILFITDLHGHFDALALLPKADLVLVGGDFTTFGTLEEFQAAVTKVEGYFPNFRGVAGNLDPSLPSDQILKDSGHLLAQQMIQCNGVNLLGISGSNLCPRPTPYEWDDEQRWQSLDSLSWGHVDILVTHAPPYGFGADVIPNGMHVGSQAVRRLAEMLKPRLHLSGHIHEAIGVFEENGSVLVNPGPFGMGGHFAYIDLPLSGKPVVELQTIGN
ncbi:MAG: metallophosphoesterase [Victivallales bacterium]|nr:metallophosphoesterase [Victivallales bacterium]